MSPAPARRAMGATGIAMLGWSLLAAGPLDAQTLDDRPVRRVEVEIGGGLLGGAALGADDAELRINETERRPFRLFTAESRFGSVPAVHARVGFAFNRRLGVEGGVVFTRPELRISLSGDAEGAPPLTIVERVDQYFIEASLVLMLDELRMAGLIPFVTAGGGYLRQLHEGLTVVEHGHLYHAGGGVKHWFLARDRGILRAAGLRADARVYLPFAGISFDDRLRPHAAVSGGVFVAF